MIITFFLSNLRLRPPKGKRYTTYILLGSRSTKKGFEPAHLHNPKERYTDALCQLPKKALGGISMYIIYVAQ